MQGAPLARALVLGVGLGLLGLGVAMPLLGQAYGRWQARHILPRGAVE